MSPLPTSETVLLGRFIDGPFDLPLYVGEIEFESIFGSDAPESWPAELQARQFFANGGPALHVIRITAAGSLHNALLGDPERLSGLRAVEPLSDARILIAPELTLLDPGEFVSAFATFRNFLNPHGIFFILDPPPGLTTVLAFTDWADASLPGNASGCAIYYPYLLVQLNGANVTVPASGAMAAVYAQTDAGDGLWRSPSGSSFPLAAVNTSPVLNAGESDSLNVQHLNPIRVFPGTGVVPWGGRTLDRSDMESRFIPVVRTREWITATLERSLAFSATNDNAVPLWTQMRSAAEGFLNSLYVQGAFAGATPSEAYFVHCDSTTTTAADVAMHRVNLLYGVALLQTSEFLTSTLTLPTYDPSREPPRPILRAKLFRGDLHMSYPTEPGFDYEFRSTMGNISGNWETAGEEFPGNGAWQRPREAVTTSNSFHRLRITSSR